MSNNYTQFSTLIKCENEEQQRQLLADIRNEDSDDGPACQANPDSNSNHNVWVWSDDEANIEELVRIVCDFQLAFDIQEHWSMEYAVTCSRPRLDEFGGGAVVCYRGEAQWMSSASFVMVTVQKLTSKVQE